MKRILIVDDDHRIRAIYKRLLVGEGFKVLTAHDAKVANEILTKDEIGLVLLDIKMPDIDGIETLKIMRSTQQGLQAIFITAYPGTLVFLFSFHNYVMASLHVSTMVIPQ